MNAPVIVFVVCAAACVIAHTAILLSTVRSRSTHTPDAQVPRPRAGVEIFWALLPAIALALVLTATYAQVRERQKTPPAEIMKVAR